jgi:uncharacterized protein (TIGR00255 family)
MPISSMTGFARRLGQTGDRSWTWEAKSVNGRGLDVRCRFPPGFESLEVAVRERVARWFSRGSLTLILTLARAPGASGIRINVDVLDRLLALVPDVQHRLPQFRPASVDGLLAVRGVVEVADDDLSEDERTALESALMEGLGSVLTALATVRREEGARLAAVLVGHTERIAELADAAAGLAAAQPPAILARLREQVAALLTGVPSLSEDRLAQEAALLATRADPREEIDRLKAHCSAARGLLADERPIGRRFDFLCQELNREANTLCSKSADIELTRIGLDLKSAIDQLREQIQNIE